MKLGELVKTKSFWSGLTLVGYGLAVKDWQAVLTGLSVIFLRDAINKVQVRKDEDRDGYGLP
jgi:hypothetical protein